MICHRYDYGADADNDDVEEEDDADADDYGDDNDDDDDVRGNWNVSSEEGIEAKTVDIWEARPAEGDPWYADHHHKDCNENCTNFNESIMIKTVSNPTTPIDDCMTNHNDDCDKRGVGGIKMVMIELLQVKNKEMAGFDVHAPRRAFNFQCQKCLWKLVSIFFSFWHKNPLPSLPLTAWCYTNKSHFAAARGKWCKGVLISQIRQLTCFSIVRASKHFWGGF